MAATALRKKIRLGDLLVEKGLITEDQLMSSLAAQKKTGQKLGRTLMLAMGNVSSSLYWKHRYTH